MRAVKADGNFLGWSKPVDFTVVATESLTPSEADSEILAVLKSELSSEDNSLTDAASRVTSAQSEQSENYADAEAVQPVSAVVLVTPESVPAPSENTAEGEDSLLIEQLAQACSNLEWWTIAQDASA